MRIMLATIVASTAVAAADPAKEVNLLTAVPATVAVSSTVANKTILPAHLVDGKLDTAWNSRTGDLEGAWVAFRLPSSARVSRIKLTVGFTKVDKKLGDLFTMNPRIKQVVITRNGEYLASKELDPEQRGLQEIQVSGGGGDYRIEVIQVVPGTKKSWREVNISELEVWGTDPQASATPRAPAIKVSSLDAGVLTQADCVAAMKSKASDLTGFTTIVLAGDLEVCELQHGGVDEGSQGVVEIAVVKRGPPAAVRAAMRTVGFHHDLGGGAVDERIVTISAFPLTTTETALLVKEIEHQGTLSSDDHHEKARLYRVEAAKLKTLVEITSSGRSGETGDDDDCTLEQPTVVAPPAMPDLEVKCTSSHTAYPGEKSGDSDRSSQRVEIYRWKAGAYVEKK